MIILGGNAQMGGLVPPNPLGFTPGPVSIAFRWLDRNGDDGQIVRELVPTEDGQRLFSKSTTTYIQTFTQTHKNIQRWIKSNKVQITFLHKKVMQMCVCSRCWLSHCNKDRQH